MSSVGAQVNKRVNGTLAVARALGDHYLKAPTMLASAVSHVPDVSVVTLYDQECTAATQVCNRASPTIQRTD
eukprot:3052099-Amphidinium_carterae.1